MSTGTSVCLLQMVSFTASGTTCSVLEPDLEMGDTTTEMSQPAADDGIWNYAIESIPIDKPTTSLIFLLCIIKDYALWQNLLV